MNSRPASARALTAGAVARPDRQSPASARMRRHNRHRTKHVEVVKVTKHVRIVPPWRSNEPPEWVRAAFDPRVPAQRDGWMLALACARLPRGVLPFGILLAAFLPDLVDGTPLDEIAALNSVDPATARRLLQELVAAGFVEIASRPRKAPAITLTTPHRSAACR